jgi:hypothetical protein
MNKQLRFLTSAIALFSLLSFVCMSWTKQANSVVSQLTPASHAQKHHFSGPVGNVSYLAEVKSRMIPVGAGIAVIAAELSSSLHQTAFIDSHQATAAVSAASCPLWLINRSLLI